MFSLLQHIRFSPFAQTAAVQINHYMPNVISTLITGHSNFGKLKFYHPDSTNQVYNQATMVNSTQTNYDMTTGSN